MRLLIAMCCVFMLTACVTPPDKQVKRFYQWYTTEKNKPDNEIFFASPELAPWVTRSTLMRLQKAYNTPDDVNSNFDSDYFTYAQDVSEKWPDNVIVSPAYHVPGGEAVNVMLGAWDEPQMRSFLVVYLTLEDQTWKISRVTAPTYEQYLP
ncbi:MAG TPA: DUF3828 domain-containing protein [Scandinavium sp.]|jgi:hypothetical protein|uniref:DUF3828 domain-containing protein n=1 Tax=Scandinavium sp. TaxID=2830653 RepID=UPI002E35D999|nr:DUF3828 domain-containing protein [Scandinavium sp.]HEX4502403.1 DUF3828 domain-containing protein [Scandinavium sp.]